ncbi:MAG: FprA family A-type flavoprotein [Bacilli bacterium]|nr:FprA family A-type flavoprotein [Bacilli bacterium]
MKQLKLKENLYWIGTVDHELREFDVVLNTPWGTTYNSYLVIGSEKKAIIDTVKHTKIEEYLAQLSTIVDIKDVDYLIVNHAEPDHTGSIKRLLELNPNLIIVGSNRAIHNVRDITNMTFESIGVKDGSTLCLGDKTFKFYNAIMLHWPDTIYSYLVEDKTLFTCDSFGAHYALDVPLQSNIIDEEEYQKAFHYYYEHIFGPFKKYYLDAIAKIEDLEIDLVCVGHGPILDSDPWKVIHYSRELSLIKNTNPKPLIIIPYVTSYGYTKLLAEKIYEGLKTRDFDVEMYNLTYSDIDAVFDRLKVADGILFGSTTMLGDALFPIWQLLIRLNPFIHGIKFGSVFGSYGWSGEGITNVDARLSQLKMKTIPPFKLKFQPSEQELENLNVFIEDFANLVNAKS